MKITFLGTGSVNGIPIWNCDCNSCTSSDPKDKRFRSAIFVQIGEKNILIDFGPDLRSQLIRNNIRKIDFAFLTHAHGDHLNGYMELATQENISLEMPEDVLEIFKSRIGKGGFNWLNVRNPAMAIKPFYRMDIGKVEIDSVKLKHQKDFEDYTPCYGYVFRSPAFSFAYLSDFNEILEEEKLNDLDLIISDGAGIKYKGSGHLGVDGSIKLFKKLKPQKMLLTHINHSTSNKFLTNYLKEHEGIGIAYDGLVIETGK